MGEEGGRRGMPMTWGPFYVGHGIASAFSSGYSGRSWKMFQIREAM
jgi:hypothetical protein